MFQRTFSFLLLLMYFWMINVSAQKGVTFERQKFQFKKVKVFDPKNIEPAFNPVITSLEAPVPGGDSYRSGLMELKRLSHEKYPPSGYQNLEKSIPIEKPEYLEGFPLRRYIAPLDTVVYVSGGVPLDNTLAISNDNYLLCGINSSIYMHDLNSGTDPLTADIEVVSFTNFATGVSTLDPFDPKVIYDPEADRFIVVFLTGRNPSNSGIVVAFSQTSDPTDPWNVYKLSGNPLNNNTWTDFPAISISKEELFITVNLLIPNVHWKVGFKSSIIWQVDKSSGYSGNNTLTTNLWSDIALDDRNLRNLHPIQGGDSIHGPNMYFLSNRNFDLKNDTIFLVEVTGSQYDQNSTLVVTPLISDVPYGLPPNGRQQDSDPNDPDDGFDTNDARVLGGIKVDNTIQFVGNTKVFETGLAGIYHGIIENVSNKPTLQGYVISDSELDFGYPNIAFVGDYACRNSTFIAFNHTSPTDFAGTSMVRYKNGGYSERVSLKDGEGYVERATGPYERWGDYYGIQRKYNEPRTVWTAGFYGLHSNNSATWVGKLRELEDCLCQKPYCECAEPMQLTVHKEIKPDSNICYAQLYANVSNGVPPYSYYWNDELSDSGIVSTICRENKIRVVDSKGCKVTKIVEIERVPPPKPTLFPNPVTNGTFSINFEISEKSAITVRIYSFTGHLVANFTDTEIADPGKNVLTFSTSPLSSGAYVVVLEASGNEVYKGKMVVP